MNIGGLIKSSKGEQGSITVVALLILVVLTILGVTITRTTTLDLRIGSNELQRKQDFYVAEGGVYREAAEVGQGDSYVVTNINKPHEVANNVEGILDSNGNPIGSLPGAEHKVYGKAYNFKVDYVGFHLPPKGYSVDQFSRYDFEIQTDVKSINVFGRFYRIGPLAK